MLCGSPGRGVTVVLMRRVARLADLERVRVAGSRRVWFAAPRATPSTKQLRVRGFARTITSPRIGVSVTSTAHPSAAATHDLAPGRLVAVALHADRLRTSGRTSISSGVRPR